MTNEEVFAKIRRAPATVIVMLSRIRVIHRVANHATTELHALLDLSVDIRGSWSYQVRCDLDIAAKLLHTRYPDKSGDIVDWVAYARSVDANIWKDMIQNIKRGYMTDRALRTPWDKAVVELNSFAAMLGLAKDLSDSGRQGAGGSSSGGQTLCLL